VVVLISLIGSPKQQRDTIMPRNDVYMIQPRLIKVLPACHPNTYTQEQVTELKESIRRNGVLKPLRIRRIGGALGVPELVDGYLRLKACLELHAEGVYMRVPVLEVDPDQAFANFK
jgi:ParB-like chromosome segregation protein Spo0J